jgi:phage terminase large subunit-like protein
MILQPHLIQSLQSSPAALKRAHWLAAARNNQLPPDGDWFIWLVLAGRGFGKTRLGAEDAAWYGATHPEHRVAIIAPTYDDARATCFEGVSGLIASLPVELIADYNRTRLELTLTNGTIYRGFSADVPDRLRGPQFHRAWCDELAAWRYPQAWDQLMFGLRLGDDPRVVVTTTPRPKPLIRTIAKNPETRITTGSTFDNAANLAPSALKELREKYEGTRLGRQELYAEILDDTPGALWTRAMIEAAHRPAPDQYDRIVVGVDPSGSDGETGDSQGIIVAGRYGDEARVIEDCTVRLGPDGWGRACVSAYHRHKADRIVAERNYGGEMVRAVIQSIDPDVPVTLVTATRGKHVRAEPIAALYEQGRVSHSRDLAQLEDQMCAMTTTEYTGEGSPDRLDAMVWAMTDLMIDAPKGVMVW